MNEERSMVVAEPRRNTHLESWGGAAQRGLEARQEREAIISSVLKEGSDFGVIPGCGNKPALLKAGAEKIADSLNLYPDYEVIPNRTIEDWNKPLFHYSYRCVLRHRGTDLAVATGIGSCNSMESRYRYREGKRKCPRCHTEAIIKGKAEYGGGWLCFAKKGGCGAKWEDGAAEIETQTAGKVPNDDIYSQVNTVDKMAQKRSMVAAALNLGFSQDFTQDVEDNPEVFGGSSSQPPPQGDYEAPPPGDSRPTAVPAYHAHELDGDSGEWTGKLIEIKEASGTSKAGKPWTKWAMKCPDSPLFSTFSETIAAAAQDMVDEVVTIQWEKSGKFYNLMGIELAPRGFHEEN